MQFLKMKIKISFILVVFSCLVHGQVNHPELNRQAARESLVPVRPGIPGQRPFWNKYAVRFIHAPSFDFGEVYFAESYRFSALSFADKKTYSFTSDHPWAPLSPIWDSLPVGEVFLKVEGIDPEGRPVALSGERKFYRAASFQGPYPEARTDYITAAGKQLEYIYRLDHVQHWLTEGIPDPEYTLNVYLSKMVTSTIFAMLKYRELNQGASGKDAENALAIAMNAADYLIGQSEPPGAPLAFLPPTYAGDSLAARRNHGKFMVNVCAAVGQAYLNLYDATRNRKYLGAATRIANTLLRIQLPSGVWPIKLQKETGKADTPNFGIPIGIIVFLERIHGYQDNPQYQKAAEKAWQWILENPLRTFNWEGQFEDVQPSDEAYKLMGMHDPSSVASYLIAHRQEDTSYLGKALEIIRFVEDQFVVWEKPLPYHTKKRSTSTWYTPSVLEQYICYVPIDASVSKVARVYFQAYDATGDELYRAKANALANSITQVQDEQGNIPTFWNYEKIRRVKRWWLNCATGSALLLLEYGQKEY